MSEWRDLGEWWIEQVRTDPEYREHVLPLLGELLGDLTGQRWLDLGCGEGQGMRVAAARGASVVGCDLNPVLLALAAEVGEVVESVLPDLSWASDGSFDGAYAVLVLEHLDDADALLREARRVVKPGGRLAVVMNHPVYTAPDSGVLLDHEVGEAFWGWGRYLEPTKTTVYSGDREVLVWHRPLGVVLETAAGAGWSLERFVERGVDQGARSDDALAEAQRHIPRLLGLGWR